MEDIMHLSSGHGGPSIRPLLTTLLLLEPSALTPSQLSSDLLMRQRMLGLPSTTPHAYDIEFSHSLDPSSDGEVTASQQNFVSRLSRPPFEFSIQCLDVAATARYFFALRSKARHDAANADVDPINLSEYDVWCSETWHNKPQDAIWLQVPGVRGAPEEPVLWMMLTEGDDGEWKLANLFALDGAEHRNLVVQLHRRTEGCNRMHRQSRKPQEEEEGGAEYINDANDFWGGFSDEGDQGRDVDEAAREGDVPNSMLDLHVAGGSQVPTTAQEAAIKDIIRGAYTLHRSARATESDRGSEEAFLALVRSAISTAGI
ncbi:hypothetical protein PHSY_002453 [Pseudozyma hubeiensis SY62]|uniref:Uncharacterized protein n=1 Tax=Pseudozyma hubeiensis (strain SY62) TaxID=1305764 RepID=R9P9Z4_PSEHS|nr:hypothetical protein PHSY_002453 [Pseudozyma hubeiensis SY62]GAC94880.1 hypothetical protein PHSY_002453 [Pseudozyma hubeiensis SY62]